MNRIQCFCGLGVLAAHFATTLALAAATEVQYSAPAACPTGSAFAEAIKARGGDVNMLSAETTADNANAALIVRILTDATGFEGRLSLQAGADKSRERTAHGATCEEVMDAMAVVAVLTLEQQTSAAAAAVVPEPEPPAAVAASPAISLSMPVDAQPLSNARPTTFEGYSPVGFSAQHQSLVVRAGTLHLDTANSITLHGGVLFGVLPNVVLPQLEASLVAARFLTLPGGTQRLDGVIPILRLSVLGPGTWRQGEDRVRIEGGVGLTLGICVSPHYNTSGWVFLVCPEIGGKALQLRATRGDEATRRRDVGFLDVGFSMSAEYNFSSYFHATLTAEGGAQLGESKVESASRAQLVSLGKAIGALSLGLGVHY